MNFLSVPLLIFFLLINVSGVDGAAVVSSENATGKGNQTRQLTLEQAYDLAMASDQSIRIAFLEIKKANLLPWSAMTRLGPRLTGGFNYNYSETTTPRANPSLLASNAQNWSVKLNQPLIDLTFFPAFRLGKLSEEASRLQYRTTIRSVLFGVAKAYYEVLKQQKIVELDKTVLDLALNQLELARNQYEAGAVSKVDVLRAQSAVETARQTLTTDENLRKLDLNTLANMLNLNGPARDFGLTQPQNAIERGIPFEKELALAQRNREDLEISRINVTQSKEQRNQILGEYAPTVSAQVVQDWNTQSNSFNSSNWGALISVQVPVFTGGQREIDLKTSEHNIKEARTQLETATKSVQWDVKATWLQIEDLRENLISLKAQVDADARNYEDLLNQYQAGAATSLDMRSALSQLSSSRTSLITQTYEYQVSLRDFERALALFENQRILRAPHP